MENKYLGKNTNDILENTSEETKIKSLGLLNGAKIEPVPEYYAAGCEVVYNNSNNAWIVLGRDRPGALHSGYGGLGQEKCASIDIVAGRISANAQSYNEDNEKMLAHPSIEYDAARIIIVQKTNVDKNFNIAKGSGNSFGRSAVAIKADDIRLVARSGIKLVTGTDRLFADGKEVVFVGGIDLIAGNNDTDLQPLVKGDNMIACVSDILFQQDKLIAIMENMLSIQTRFNEALSDHYHYSPFWGNPTTVSPPVAAEGKNTVIQHAAVTKADLIKARMNIIMLKNNYLAPSGEGYFNSRYNKTN